MDGHSQIWLWHFVHRNAAACDGLHVLHMVGIQLILMGLLAEILVRTYHESQDKRVYTVKKTVNID